MDQNGPNGAYDAPFWSDNCEIEGKFICVTIQNSYRFKYVTSTDLNHSQVFFAD